MTFTCCAIKYPDGDTLGSAAALYLGLRQKGKRVSIRCGDPIPQKYDYMFEGIEFPDFEPQFICAVDIADPQLLGQRLSPYAQRVDLCIDHHGSNTNTPDNTLSAGGGLHYRDHV